MAFVSNDRDKGGSGIETQPVFTKSESEGSVGQRNETRAVSFGNNGAVLSFKSKESEENQIKYSEDNRMSLAQIIEVDANRESSTITGLRFDKTKPEDADKARRLPQISEDDEE